MNQINEARILIVDDQESNVLLLEMMLDRQGYANVTSIRDSSQTVSYFEENPPDLLLLDLHMPAPDGFEVMELLKEWTTGQGSVPVLVLTADASRETKLRALDAGASDFVSKPFEFVEVFLRMRHLLETRQLQLELESVNRSLEARVRRRTSELEQARTEAFQRLGIAAEFRDDATCEHTKRVGITAGMLAAELGLDPAMVEILERIAPLHDVGKIGIPDSILLKPGKLDDHELAIMRTHATIGRQMLAGSSSPVLEVAAEIALTHHERWDGTGYPAGLAGTQIPINGRIVALADAFDAMTHTRPYKEAMTVADAVAEVERSTGSHFDPTVAAAFHRLDPELLASPPILGSDPSLTDGAWRALQDATGITHDETEHATNAAIMAILADTPTATLVIDDARRYISANAAACEMFGLSIDELRKQRIDDFAPAEVRDQLDAIWADFMTVGVQNIVFELQLPDGTKHMTTYRGVAHLLPGRHLLLLTPADDSASAMSAAFVASVDPSDTTNAAGDAGQRVLANGRRG